MFYSLPLYAYDLFSRQVSYTWNNIGYTYYTYRGDGLRHSKGNLKHYWDNGNITLEKNGSDVIEYYRGITLVYKDDGNDKTYYLYNGHLDVVNLTDEDGVKTKTYEYDAFGVEQDEDIILVSKEIGYTFSNFSKKVDALTLDQSKLLLMIYMKHQYESKRV